MCCTFQANCEKYMYTQTRRQLKRILRCDFLSCCFISCSESVYQAERKKSAKWCAMQRVMLKHFGVIYVSNNLSRFWYLVAYAYRRFMSICIEKLCYDRFSMDGGAGQMEKKQNDFQLCDSKHLNSSHFSREIDTQRALNSVDCASLFTSITIIFPFASYQSSHSTAPKRTAAACVCIFFVRLIFASKMFLFDICNLCVI